MQKINIGNVLHEIVCGYTNYNWKYDKIELSKIKRLLNEKLQELSDNPFYEITEDKFKHYVKTYSSKRRNKWRTKESLFKCYKDNYKRLNTRYELNKLLMSKENLYFTKQQLIERLLLRQSYLKDEYIKEFTKNGEFVDVNGNKINMKQFKWKLNLSYVTITNMLINNSKEQMLIELENLHKSWENLYIYIKDESIYENCKTCYERLTNSISDKILTYSNYKENLNKCCDKRKNKLSDERKDEFKLLWNLFDEGWKNREIFAEYSDKFSKSIINRERTKYNKEQRDKNNINDNTQLDDMLKCRDVEKFKLFLTQDKYSSYQDLMNNILSDFDKINNGQFEESIDAFNRLKELLS